MARSRGPVCSFEADMIQCILYEMFLLAPSRADAFIAEANSMSPSDAFEVVEDECGPRLEATPEMIEAIFRHHLVEIPEIGLSN